MSLSLDSYFDLNQCLCLPKAELNIKTQAGDAALLPAGWFLVLNFILDIVKEAGRSGLLHASTRALSITQEIPLHYNTTDSI